MKACSRKILELFYNAKHSGRVTKPDAIGRVGEDDDGLVIELTWRVTDAVITEAKFRAFGNPNAIAITSLMTDNIIGKSVEDAMLISEDVITDNLEEFKPEYLEAFDMVRMAMTEAYNNYLRRQGRKAPVEREKGTTVAVVEDNNIETEEFDITSEEELITTKVEYEAQNIEIEEEKRGRGRPRKEVTETVEVETGEKRGRGRPRKIVDEAQIVEVGEKRGRGRPRKERLEGEELENTEKRGRGRPRKERVETEEIVIGEKRGRGRPRKIVDENEEVVIGEKRGRGRPRKVVDETTIVEIGEKRGRGRPRKERPEGEELESTEKRGRGRPKKVVDETQTIEVGEKRGRGRPREIVDESQIVEVGEKRGRGRPKKQIIYTLPSDLDEVIDDEDVNALINGKAETIETSVASETSTTIQVQDTSTQTTEINNKAEQTTNNFVDNLITNKLIDEDDDMFDADYDLFKSNIRNILSGKEVSSTNHYGKKNDDVKIESTPVNQNDNVDSDNASDVENENKVFESRTESEEKRGRGRPKKIVIETEEEPEEKRGRGRPRVNAVNSLTRSLTSSNGMPSYHRNTQDIVFASKNVTTTNINVNVTKTTTGENESTVKDYSISSVKESSTVSTPVNMLKEDKEIDIEPVNTFKNVDLDDFDDDFEDEIDDSDIKDEAPKGGIEDLLKALLNDD